MDEQRGLPQNSGRALVQTCNGYLWIGTQNSLVRFNGAVFQVFNKDNTPALKHNDITVLIETLWIKMYYVLVKIDERGFHLFSIEYWIVINILPNTHRYSCPTMKVDSTKRVR
jgi:ligand-binding sensor domain-containing protein